MKPFETISPVDWKETFEKEKGKIVDVRTADEFEDSFIEGAVNIDYNLPTFAVTIEKLGKVTPLFLYCRSGARAKNAMDLLQSKGFEKVYNLDGGIMKWEFDGFEVEYGDDF
ncbi:MAG: rhodanese-like domain-containing protein [Bacteroidia bacterium]